ncbi:hypothetical protein CSV79_08775 [Sporosarcina sp. P13]|uniref:hypothetical protein n=1 Tax=Sporosarcina sp. P13 TaxID=2048263 RepID=UPI000C16B749|nr:hypothetical protein [Sporosarcina sp. P13]PIC64003.1 hypothetical protein CSV79_08775 [Sporosarcina sp. P13]
MKKKLKIFLLAILAVIVVGGGYLLYIFQFKEYEVADEEIDEIMENPYDIVLPNGTKLVIEDEATSKDQAEKSNATDDSKKPSDQQKTGDSSSTDKGDNKTSGATGSDTSEKNQSPTTENKATTSANKPTTGNVGSEKPVNKATVAAIKRKYEPTVNNLQGQVDGKINALIGRAKNEYATKKANGESVNYAYFYNKYMSAAESLEAQTDAVFYGVVASLEKDLQANGYDKAYSKSVRDEYEAKKKARRDSILSQAMGKK